MCSCGSSLLRTPAIRRGWSQASASGVGSVLFAPAPRRLSQKTPQKMDSIHAARCHECELAVMYHRELKKFLHRVCCRQPSSTLGEKMTIKSVALVCSAALVLGVATSANAKVKPGQ